MTVCWEADLSKIYDSVMRICKFESNYPWNLGRIHLYLDFGSKIFQFLIVACLFHQIQVGTKFESNCFGHFYRNSAEHPLKVVLILSIFENWIFFCKFVNFLVQIEIQCQIASQLLKDLPKPFENFESSFYFRKHWLLFYTVVI